MNKTIITFQADEQNLVKVGGTDNYASDTISYVEAHFNLGTNWSGFDSVRAMWRFGNEVYGTVLDADGICLVPWEALQRRGEVKVNLVGSIVENGVLTDRLTTFPIIGLIVTKIAQVDGENSANVTPSEVEQYSAIVKADADRAVEAKMGAITAQGLAEDAQLGAETAEQNARASAEGAYSSRENAEENALKSEGYAVGKQNGIDVGRTSPYYHNNAEWYSDLAQQSASESGYVEFRVDENGHLIFTKTDYANLNFSLDNGHLILEVA